MVDTRITSTRAKKGENLEDDAHYIGESTGLEIIIVEYKDITDPSTGYVSRKFGISSEKLLKVLLDAGITYEKMVR